MSVTLNMRRPWNNARLIFLVGPGGVGKSSLGAHLAPLLDRALFDLDLVFCDCIGIIGPYIARHGYEAYRAANLDLAEQLVSGQAEAAIFVTSSGFLAADGGTEDRARAESLLSGGYVLTILPSLDIEEAAGIVVERQIRRPFGLVRESEDVKFRARFAACRDAADMLVVSQADPPAIADAVCRALV